MKRNIILMFGTVGLLSVVLAFGDVKSPTTQTRPAKRKTIRLLTVGNSFANNALKYLPQIVKASGNELIVGRANLGGCSLARHWKHAASYQANPNDPAGKPYGKKKESLAELLKSQKWDVVTIQQASWLSPDIKTFEPYAGNLVNYIKKYAPQAEILFQQTWAYRVDDPRFAKEKGKEREAFKTMYEQVRESYHAMAKKLGVGIIPSGDAMYLADTHETQGFKPDGSFDAKTARRPALPDQTHSLHVGYFWRKQKDGGHQLRLDGHHANRAGEYLIGCVWFEVLYGQSVLDNRFVPRGLAPAYAKFLRQTAHEAVAKLKAERKAAKTKAALKK